jgi:N-acetylmuramoyl-L-alanine amidase
MALTRIAIAAGHSAAAPGASGNGYAEHAIARTIKDWFVKDGRAAGLSITDCTWDGAGNANTELSQKVAKANASGAQLFIDVHFNANSGTPGTGVEVFSYGSDPTYARPVCDALASAFGLANRGVKSGNNLYVINSTSMAAILIETAFINNAGDMAKVGGNERKVADTVLGALTGRTVAPAPEPPKVDPAKTGTKVSLWTANLGDAQRFHISTPDGEGYVKITNVGSGKNLNVRGGIAKEGTEIIAYPADGTRNELFRIADMDGFDGFDLSKRQTIRSALGDLYVDAEGSKAANGTPIIIWPYHGKSNQQWIFVPAPLVDGKESYFIINAATCMALDVNRYW